MREQTARINMRSWRNWQTRTVQVRVGNHGGSNPFDRTKKMSTPLGVLIFLVPIRGFEPDSLNSFDRTADSKIRDSNPPLVKEPPIVLPRINHILYIDRIIFYLENQHVAILE